MCIRDRRSIGPDTKFTVCLFFHSLCTVTDFSAGALPIGVKLCMVVQPHLRQVFSYLEGVAARMAEFWVSTEAMWRDMILTEPLVIYL